MNAASYQGSRSRLAGYRRDAMLSRSRLGCVVACLDALSRVILAARGRTAGAGLPGDLLGLCSLLREAADPDGGEGAIVFASLVDHLEELGHHGLTSGGMPPDSVLEQMASIVEHLRTTFALYAAEPRR